LGKKVLIIISVIILILALAFAGYKLFRVRDFTVSGCGALSEEDVVARSGIAYDQHLLEIDFHKAAAAIEEDPMIASAGIEIAYPDEIAIMIEERRPAACIVKGDALIVIDRECYVMQVRAQTEADTYPVVSGLQLGDFQIGLRLGAQDMFQLDVLSRVLSAIGDAQMDISGVDVTRVADVALYMRDGLTIEIGDDTQLPQKLELAESALQELQKRGESGGILDVASTKSAYYREN